MTARIIAARTVNLRRRTADISERCVPPSFEQSLARTHSPDHLRNTSQPPYLTYSTLCISAQVRNQSWNHSSSLCYLPLRTTPSAPTGHEGRYTLILCFRLADHDALVVLYGRQQRQIFH